MSETQGVQEAQDIQGKVIIDLSPSVQKEVKQLFEQYAKAKTALWYYISIVVKQSGQDGKNFQLNDGFTQLVETD